MFKKPKSYIGCVCLACICKTDYLETYSTLSLTTLERVAHYGQPINIKIRVQQLPLPIIDLNYILQSLYIDSVRTQSTHGFQSSCESIIKSETEKDRTPNPTRSSEGNFKKKMQPKLKCQVIVKEYASSRTDTRDSTQYTRRKPVICKDDQ